MFMEANKQIVLKYVDAFNRGDYRSAVWANAIL